MNPDQKLLPAPSISPAERVVTITPNPQSMRVDQYWTYIVGTHPPVIWRSGYSSNHPIYNKGKKRRYALSWLRPVRINPFEAQPEQTQLYIKMTEVYAPFYKSRFHNRRKKL